KAENEEVAQAFLGGRGDFYPEDAGALIDESGEAEKAFAGGGADFLTLMPHRHGTGGFFIAAMRKRK
ncbi:MAG TPA: SAM-dependent methyltransferase, partial [Ruminococcaceae bacterium]|nr:SAM-dependent methyltransferase [Oscillospiraceae bacterium]